MSSWNVEVEDIWRCETARYIVAMEAHPEQDLDLSFDDTGEVALALENGTMVAFSARAVVYLKKESGPLVLAQRWLGNCIYQSLAEFWAENFYSADMMRDVIRHARLVVAQMALGLSWSSHPSLVQPYNARWDAEIQAEAYEP